MEPSMRHLFAALICAGMLAANAPAASASPIALHIYVNTAALIGDPTGPFSVDFQLTDGSGSLAVPNTATLSNFTFGGGGVVGLPNLFGGVSGDLGCWRPVAGQRPAPWRRSAAGLAAIWAQTSVKGWCRRWQQLPP